MRESRRRQGAGWAGVACHCALALVASAASAQDLERARQLHADGRLVEALAAYEEIIDARAVLEPGDVGTALNNSCAIHNAIGNYDVAEATCRDALGLRRGIGDARGEARTLNNLAIALQNRGDYRSARDALAEALAVNSRRGDVEAQVLNLANLGALATLSGNYGQALEFHQRAADLASTRTSESWAREQLEIAAINRGVVLEHLGAYREALDLYRKTLEGPAPAPRRRAQILLNRGVIYRNLGDPVQAIEAFEEVASIYRELSDPDGLANALLNLGIAYHLNLERWEEAEAAYREALALAARHGDRPEEIRGRFYLGEFLRQAGRLDDAQAQFETGLEVAERSGSAEGRWSSLAGLGRIAVARGDIVLSLELFEDAIGVIEGAGAELSGEAVAGFFGRKRGVYEAAVRVLVTLASKTEEGTYAERALDLVQQAKARDLLDALGETGWPARPLAGTALRRAAEKAPVLEYFVAEGSLLRWTISPRGTELADLGPYEEIEAEIETVYEALAEGRLPLDETLAQLSAWLLAGIDGTTLAAGRLTVASDRALRHLPFELLALDDAPELPAVERFAIAYAPSTSSLVWLEEREQRAQRPPAASIRVRAFGGPNLDPAGRELRSPAALIAERLDLPPLAAAEGELRMLARKVGGRQELLIGEQATETAFRAAAGRPAAVVHLATHAVIDNRPGGRAAVLLGASQEDDGLLEPREIAALDYRAVITVLAACRTAVGSADGHALSSLAGAFLAAGSSAVIATLWDVGDEATAVFMEQLYRELASGHEPALALQRAKLTLRSDPGWAKPSIWAAYVVIGEAQPITAGRPAASLLLAAAAMVLALGVAAAVLLRRRR